MVILQALTCSLDVCSIVIDLVENSVSQDGSAVISLLRSALSNNVFKIIFTAVESVSVVRAGNSKHRRAGVVGEKPSVTQLTLAKILEGLLQSFQGGYSKSISSSMQMLIGVTDDICIRAENAEA
jgi:hypothetical protein